MLFCLDKNTPRKNEILLERVAVAEDGRQSSVRLRAGATVSPAMVHDVEWRARRQQSVTRAPARAAAPHSNVVASPLLTLVTIAAGARRFRSPLFFFRRSFAFARPDARWTGSVRPRARARDSGAECDALPRFESVA